jgi:C-terminal processing protease CtpA/Prc
MNEREFLGCIAPLVASIRCSHTSVYPSRQHVEYLEQRAKYFPIPVRALGRRCYIARTIGKQPAVPKGSEITSINGQETAKVIDRLLACVSSDGHVSSGRQRKIETHFAVYLKRYVDQAETFRLRLVTPAGEEQALTINGVGRDQLQAKKCERTAPVSFCIDEARSAAILRIRTLYTVTWKNHQQKPRRFLKTIFRQMAEQQVETLIIDLRGNAGGSIFLAADLFAYFADEDIRWCREYRVSPTTRPTYRDAIQWNPLVALKWLVTHRSGNHRVYPWYRLLKKTPIKRDHHFSGRVLMLVDGGTSSAAAMLASMAQACDRVTIVGEETGGTAAGNGVSPVTLVLPNSRVRLDLALGYVTLDRHDPPEDGRGVIPQYTVRPAPLEQDTEDSVLAFALSLAGRRVQGEHETESMKPLL